MKKILGTISVVLVCGVALAIDGFVLKNTGNSDVFTVKYESGKATNTIDGVVVADAVISTASASTTVTAGSAVAVSGSLMPISAATAVTNATLAAVAPSKVGQSVVIINTGTNAITILDSAPAYLSTNAVLGQYDSLGLVVQATNVLVQTSTSNN